MEQLSLFRDQDAEDIARFMRAKELKGKAQKLCKEKESDLKGQQRAQACYLHFNTRTEALLGGERTQLEEESSPRSLVRRFISNVRFIHFKGSTSPKMDEKSQVSPYWAGHFYSEGNIETYWFLELCRRIFSARFAVDVIKKRDIISKIIEQPDSIKVLRFDHLFGIFPKIDSRSVFLHNELNGYKANLLKLYNFARENKCLLLGYSRIFQNRDLVVGFKEKYSDRDYIMFGNDYIFLNNAEFPWEQKAHDTSGWPNIVFSPVAIRESEEGLPNLYWFYCKSAPDAIFHRIEIFGMDLEETLLIELALDCEKRLQIEGFPEDALIEQ